MFVEKLKIIECMTIEEFKKTGKLAKKGYQCRMELMGAYVYLEYYKFV